MSNNWLDWRRNGWELTLIALIIVAGAISSQLSPYYLSFDQIADSTREFTIPGILALGLMAVVVLGEIDISPASTLAVGAVLFAKFSALNWNLLVAIPCVLLACGLLGALNGFLVARIGLPSLAVTLGTMGAYRGLAFIIGSEKGYTDFNDTYLYLGSEHIAGTNVPVAFALFLVLALVFALLIHSTVFGRRCYSIGHNREAAWFSGIKVDLVKIQAYTLLGVLAGISALAWIGQYGSARGDNADGMILLVITTVVLGGVDINGGRGTVLGVVLALFLLGTIRNGLGLANVPGPTQTVILGSLLVVGVLRPLLSTVLRRLRALIQRSFDSTRPSRVTS